MRISVITVCFNSEKTIRNTIESVLGQTYDDVEYWIIDGKSTDNTVRIAEEYYDCFSKRGYEYHICSEPDRGIYDAMNKGILKSSGEIIGIINSDDWYELDALENVAREYATSHFDFFYADVRLIRQNGTTLIKHSKFDRIPTSRHWNHPTTFVTKSTYDEIGTFSCKGLYDDFDLLLRVRSRGKIIKIYNKVLANFSVGGISTQKTLKDVTMRIKDRYRCYRDNGFSFLYYFECVLTEVAKAMLS